MSSSSSSSSSVCHHHHSSELLFVRIAWCCRPTVAVALVQNRVNDLCTEKLRSAVLKAYRLKIFAHGYKYVLSRFPKRPPFYFRKESSRNQSHAGSTVAQRCVNSDTSSQWEGSKFDPAESKPVNRLPKNLGLLIRSAGRPHRSNLWRSRITLLETVTRPKWEISKIHARWRTAATLKMVTSLYPESFRKKIVVQMCSLILRIVTWAIFQF